MTQRYGEPTPPDRDEIRAQIDEWVHRPALTKLARSFGFTDGTRDTLEHLRGLDQWSADHWDFRGQRERWEASEPELSDTQALLTGHAARDLGLAEESWPVRDHYDVVVVLGAGNSLPMLRAAWAAEVLGKVDTPFIALLGSGRPVQDRERPMSDVYAPGAATEFDLMAAAAETAFGLGGGIDHPEDHPAGSHEWSWAHVRTYQDEGAGRKVAVLSAPTSDLARRANTADTVAFLAERFPDLRHGRALFVTSAIFVPFQHADAVRVLGLPNDMTVETVGFPPDQLTEPATPTMVLQEIRSAVRSMHRLYDAC